ncbi:MAG: hypothetical protein OJF49_003928 [Ktedonobacterales bacterium]|jgi:uncharacterized protein (DUF2252 family)|nr:MAG: hypothetical protein OJF49_003928 [Ktedonobacterales bacterium]
MAAVQFVTSMPVTATRAERHAAGKDLRSKTPRTSHGAWAAAADRPDPIRLLEQSNRTRVPELVPIRYGRMSLSPFTFLRGAAIIMASDLADTPISGLRMQICGDAHLSNYGGFATPERILDFDVNDFDETLPGPWEWDIKRLAASIVVAGRQNAYTAQDNHQAVVDSIREYQTSMRSLAQMGRLDVWYQHIDLEEILGIVKGKELKRIRKQEHKAAHHTSEGVFPKLAEVVDGHYQIKDEPPLIVHVAEQAPIKTKHNGKAKGAATITAQDEHEQIKGALAAYSATLPEACRQLLSKYRFVDVARKVVGVGSVGTRCWVALFMAGGDGDDPLFLQIKEADASTLERYLGASANANHGERVVQGQRLMQEASDIFLGWTHVNVDLYVRQLRDMKWSVDIETMTRHEFEQYTRLCAMALARAHARTGDPAMISGYLGSNDIFAEAIALFAEAYADQTERDHAALLAAIKDGRVQAEVDV